MPKLLPDSAKTPLWFQIRKVWRKGIALWKYRHADPEVCCCGCDIGKGGDICRHGGCRSMKEYAIHRLVEKP